MPHFQRTDAYVSVAMKWDGRIEIDIELRPGFGGEGALMFRQRSNNIVQYRLTFLKPELGRPQGVDHLSGRPQDTKKRDPR